MFEWLIKFKRKYEKQLLIMASLIFAALLYTRIKAEENTWNMEQHNINTLHNINTGAAKAITEKGVKLAGERKLNLAIAVVDRSGALLSFIKMDAAAPVTVEVAIGKAKSAVQLQAPTKIFEDFVNNGQPAMATTPGILPLQGGIPIYYGQEIVGAVGVSGSSGQTDNEVASLLADYLNKKN